MPTPQCVRVKRICTKKPDVRTLADPGAMPLIEGLLAENIKIWVLVQILLTRTHRGVGVPG